MAGDQVLTQADIDALLSGKPATAPPPPAPVQAAAPAPPVYQAPAPQPPPPAAAAPSMGAGDALRGTVDQLGARLRAVEEAVGRLSSQPGTAGGAPSASTDTVRQLQQQLQALNDTMNTVLASLPNTVGFRAHETFVCSECNTQGLVATRLNCTACGKENWWGWFPPPPQQ